MKTDTSEKGLESLMVADMLASGWKPGVPADYDREYAVDHTQLSSFLKATQEPLLEAFDLASNSPFDKVLGSPSG